MNWSLLSWVCTKTSHQDTFSGAACYWSLPPGHGGTQWGSSRIHQFAPCRGECLEYPEGFFILWLVNSEWYRPTFQIFQDFYPTRIGGDPSDQGSKPHVMFPLNADIRINPYFWGVMSGGCMLSRHDVLAARTTTFPRQEGPNKRIQQAKVFVKSSYDTTF